MGRTILILFLVFLFVACAPVEKPGEDTIKIGAVLPLRGYGVETGETSLKGYELAIKEINERGGISGKKVELIVADHQGDSTAEALSAYRSLKLRGIHLMLGPHFSPLGQAIAPVACEENTLLISPSIGIRGFVETCDYIFDLWPTDHQNSVRLGETVAKKGYKRIAIIGSEQSWEKEQAEGVKQGVENVNGTVVEYIIAQDAATVDFRTEATKVIYANADAIIFTNYGYMHTVAKRLRELGSNADFYSVTIDERLKNAAEGALENTIIITSFTPTEEFKSKYKLEYNKDPDFSADTSYDSVILLAQAIDSTNSTDPKVLASHLHAIDYYEGASGKLQFTTAGGVTKQAAFLTIRNNTIIKYEE